MEIDILTLIGNYAFPICMCIALFWKLDKDAKENREAQEKRDQLNREAQEKRDQLHREEVQSLRSSLDNNTAALAQLSLTINTHYNDD